MRFDNLIETARYLSYSFMSTRFIEITSKPKKTLEEKDIEFLLRVIEFFEDAQKCRKACETYTYTPSETFEKYQLCLEFIPKMYNDEDMKKYDGIIEGFIDDIKNALDMNEIIPEAFEKQSEFFRNVRKFCIHKHSELTMGCW